MTQIRIECPTCATQGKLDSSALPVGGANIRCPACGVIFFVGGPESDDPTLGRPAADVGVDRGAPDAPPATERLPSGGHGMVERFASTGNTPAVERVPSGDSAQADPDEAPAAASSSGLGSATAPATEDAPAAESPAASVAPAPARVSVPRLPIPGMATESSPDAPAADQAAEPEPPRTPSAPAPEVDARPPDVEAPSSPDVSRHRVASTGGEQVAIPSGFVSAPAFGSGSRPATAYSGGAPPVSEQVPTIPIPRVGTGPTPRQERATPDSEARTSFRVTASGNRRVVVAGDDETVGSGSHAAAIGGGHQAHIGSWRVRAGTGMVYDFPDTESLRAWLESRPSLSDLTASVDGGTTFQPLASWPELAHVDARGVRAASSGRGPVLGQSLQGISTGAAPQRVRQHRTDATAAVGDRLVGRSTTSDTSAVPKRRARRAAREEGESGNYGRVIMLVVLLVAAGAGAVGFTMSQRAPTLPDTLVGAQMGWLLETLNGGAADLSEIEVTSHFAPSALAQLPPGRIIEELQFWDGRYPAYTLWRVERGHTDTHLEIVVDTPLQDMGVIEVALEPEPPHRIAEFWIRPYR